MFNEVSMSVCEYYSMCGCVGLRVGNWYCLIFWTIELDRKMYAFMDGGGGGGGGSVTTTRSRRRSSGYCTRCRKELGGAEGVSFANWSFFALCLKLVVFACGAYARILHHMRGRFEGGRVVYHIATILIYIGRYGRQ